MNRREFVSSVGMGSAGVMAAAGTAAAAGMQDEHDHRPLSGNLAATTVAFGAWIAGVDRMATPEAPAAPNLHRLLPHTAVVKAGGAVTFIVAGFHQIVAYAPGTKPSDIDTTQLLPVPGLPPVLGFIDDPRNRIYRGISPVGLPQDRVEVVQFTTPGLYLVICAFNVHFADQMYGWVRVVD